MILNVNINHIKSTGKNTLAILTSNIYIQTTFFLLAVAFYTILLSVASPRQEQVNIYFHKRANHAAALEAKTVVSVKGFHGENCRHGETQDF